MKQTNLLLPQLALAAALLLLACRETSHAQGTLTPPGAPAPTMKTLTQVEPRTPISELPFTINAPGSYYLTGSLNSTNSGITVAASDVTLDLMGFTISGAQTTNHHGIHVAGGKEVMLRNVAIRNGGVTRFGTGVLVENTQGGEVYGLTVHQNASHGVHIRNNSPGLCTSIGVEQCIIADNSGNGVFLEGVNGSPEKNHNHTVRNNRISGNDTAGIRSISAQGCLIDGNLIGPHTPATNAYAIFSGLSRNLVIRNISQGNTNAIGTAFFFNQAADTYGPRVESKNLLNLSETNGQSNPWANFSK